MSNSSLITYTLLSPNYSPRIRPITKITIHHAVAIGVSSYRIAETFLPPERKASANYTIGVSGDITLVVPEEYCSWASGTWNGYDNGNDGMAVTIEVANDGGEPDWHVSDATMASLIRLCADICRRNNILTLNFTGDATGNLTQHNYFQATRCPGEYLKSKFQYIADEVNKLLGSNVEYAENVDVYYAAYANGQWLGTITNYNEINDDGYAGWHAKPMSGIRASLSKGHIVYQAHTQAHGWLDWVTDLDESQGGYAGMYGHNIDGLRMKLEGLGDNYHVEYRFGLLGGGPQPWARDGEQIGVFGNAYDKFQIRIINDPIITEKKEETKSEVYRVRASWEDAESQVGAYSNLDGAKAKADEFGYKVYNSKGEEVYAAAAKEIVEPEPEIIEPTPAPEIPEPAPEPSIEIEEPKQENIWIKLIRTILEAILGWLKNE